MWQLDGFSYHAVLLSCWPAVKDSCYFSRGELNTRLLKQLDDACHHLIVAMNTAHAHGIYNTVAMGFMAM